MISRAELYQLVVDGDLAGLKDLEAAGEDVNVYDGYGFFCALLEKNFPLADWFRIQSTTRFSLRTLFSTDDTVPAILANVVRADCMPATAYLLSSVPEVMAFRDQLLPQLYYKAISTGSSATASYLADELPEEVVHAVQSHFQTHGNVTDIFSFENNTEADV